MAALKPHEIQAVVEKVVARLGSEVSADAGSYHAPTGRGLFPDVDSAVDAAADAFPIFWTRSNDGPSSAQFRWFAVSTEHMPVNMPVPLTDLIGDFSGNDILDVADINRLASAIQAGKIDLALDLNQNGIVDRDDHKHWVTNIRQT